MLYKFCNNKNDHHKSDNFYYILVYVVLFGIIFSMDSCTVKKRAVEGDIGGHHGRGELGNEPVSGARQVTKSAIETDLVVGNEGDMGNNKVQKKNIVVTSSAFIQGGSIPSEYSCEKTDGGKDVSPPLHWDAAPAGTQSIALICDDPDAPMGLWVHWVVFNLPADITDLPRRVSIAQIGGIEGVNSWGKNGYGGPCPPDGEHRYFFTVYMLNEKLNLDKSATRQQLLEAINADAGRLIVAQGQLMGRYKKKHA